MRRGSDREPQGCNEPLSFDQSSADEPRADRSRRRMICLEPESILRWRFSMMSEASEKQPEHERVAIRAVWILPMKLEVNSLPRKPFRPTVGASARPRTL